MLEGETEPTLLSMHDSRFDSEVPIQLATPRLSALLMETHGFQARCRLGVTSQNSYLVEECSKSFCFTCRCKEDTRFPTQAAIAWLLRIE